MRCHALSFSSDVWRCVANIRGTVSDDRRRRSSQCVLTIRDSKFFKTRLVPIGPKTVQVLAEYASRHDIRATPRKLILHSLLDGTGSESTSASSKELSSKFGCMLVCIAKVVRAASRACMTCATHQQSID